MRRSNTRKRRQAAVMAEDAQARAASFAWFGVVGGGDPLRYGDSMVWRAGDLVFKRAPSIEEWAWLGEHLPTVREEGFRMTLPVPATDGRWVVDGWCAQTWLAGDHARSERWLDVLVVGERFHRACAQLPRPAFIDARDHPWAIGDRVAWGEAPSPADHELLRRLLSVRRPLDLPSQLIHGDLTENVLFDPKLPPAVIDPTPYWRPAGFASAIVVGDAIRWFAADPIPLLDATSHIAEFPQLLVRASIARLVTTLVFGHADPAFFERDVDIVVDLAG
jgi:uncharacterized protein (TIGR02569 family)